MVLTLTTKIIKILSLGKHRHTKTYSNTFSKDLTSLWEWMRSLLGIIILMMKMSNNTILGTPTQLLCACACGYGLWNHPCTVSWQKHADQWMISYSIPLEHGHSVSIEYSNMPRICEKTKSLQVANYGTKALENMEDRSWCLEESALNQMPSTIGPRLLAKVGMIKVKNLVVILQMVMLGQKKSLRTVFTR